MFIDSNNSHKLFNLYLFFLKNKFTNFTYLFFVLKKLSNPACIACPSVLYSEMLGSSLVDFQSNEQ
jgi:hypothetical protein